MLCLKCLASEFEIKSIPVEQEFKGQSFNIVTEATVCKKCGFSHFTDDQAAQLIRLTADAYTARQRDV